ncbi:hypothetical protein H5410_030195 [Solanum commersonii]|uniref:Uncharacterized protein n=1 Tax=Solanum commersonii TaxID=4109 RepID=A0A9J5YEY7_SOLCO|nr:hypothetical protein H5410_030195 [Solanum commersonii]
MGNNGASTVVSTSTSPLLVTSPNPCASSSHDSAAINPSTASNSIESTFLALGKCLRQVSRKLSGYDYVLPPSLAQLNDQPLSPTPSANSMSFAAITALRRYYSTSLTQSALL